MEKILVYLGSDHVIQHPSFGVRENILKMTTDREVAISQACEQDAAAVINTYSLDLDSLSVKAKNLQFEYQRCRSGRGCTIDRRKRRS